MFINGLSRKLVRHSLGAAKRRIRAKEATIEVEEDRTSEAAYAKLSREKFARIAAEDAAFAARSKDAKQ